MNPATILASITLLLLYAAFATIIERLNVGLRRRIQVRLGQQPGLASKQRPLASRFVFHLAYGAAICAVVLFSLQFFRPE